METLKFVWQWMIGQWISFLFWFVLFSLPLGDGRTWHQYLYEVVWLHSGFLALFEELPRDPHGKSSTPLPTPTSAPIEPERVIEELSKPFRRAPEPQASP